MASGIASLGATVPAMVQGNIFAAAGLQNTVPNLTSSFDSTSEQLVGSFHVAPSSLAAGGLAEKAAAIFRVYDIDGKNYLGGSDLITALGELGVLHGLSSKKLGEVLNLDKINIVKRYTLQDFIQMYERLAQHQSKVARDERVKAMSMPTEPPPGAEHNASLKQCFTNFCKYAVGQGRMLSEAGELKMNNLQLQKLCHDLGIMSEQGPVTPTIVDIVFAKVKPPGGRRLTFHHYLKALAALSDESGMNLFDVLCADDLGFKPKPNLPPMTDTGSKSSSPMRLSTTLPPVAQPQDQRSRSAGDHLQHDMGPAKAVNRLSNSDHAHLKSVTVPGVMQGASEGGIKSLRTGKGGKQSMAVGQPKVNNLVSTSPDELIRDAGFKPAPKYGEQPPSWMVEMVNRVMALEARLEQRVPGLPSQSQLVQHADVERRLQAVEQRMPELDGIKGILKAMDARFHAMEARHAQDYERLQQQLGGSELLANSESVSQETSKKLQEMEQQLSEIQNQMQQLQEAAVQAQQQAAAAMAAASTAAAAPPRVPTPPPSSLVLSPDNIMSNFEMLAKAVEEQQQLLSSCSEKLNEVAASVPKVNQDNIMANFETLAKAVEDQQQQTDKLTVIVEDLNQKMAVAQDTLSQLQPENVKASFDSLTHAVEDLDKRVASCEATTKQLSPESIETNFHTLATAIDSVDQMAHQLAERVGGMELLAEGSSNTEAEAAAAQGITGNTAAGSDATADLEATSAAQDAPAAAQDQQEPAAISTGMVSTVKQTQSPSLTASVDMLNRQIQEFKQQIFDLTARQDATTAAAVAAAAAGGSSELQADAVQDMLQQITGLRDRVQTLEAQSANAAATASAEAARPSTAASLKSVRPDATADDTSAEGGDSLEAIRQDFDAFAEQLNDVLKQLQDDVEDVKKVAEQAAGTAGTAGVPAPDAQLLEQVDQLARRLDYLERDVKVWLTSYAKIADVKESENHVLDRHEQLHVEVENLKENLRVVSDRMSSQEASKGARSRGPTQNGSNGQLENMDMEAILAAAAAVPTKEVGKDPKANANQSKANAAAQEAAKQQAILLEVVKQIDAAISSRLDPHMKEDVEVLDKALVKVSEDVSILDQAISKVDEKVGKLQESFLQRMDIKDKVLMKIARQIDHVQNELRERIGMPEMRFSMMGGGFDSFQSTPMAASAASMARMF